MSTFLFWNVDLRGPDVTDTRRIGNLTAALIRRHTPDVVCLIECGIPTDRLLQAVGNDGGMYAAIQSQNRFRLLVRFDPKFVTRVVVVPESDRLDVWRLALPLQHELLIAVVHGLDRRNNAASRRELFMQQVGAKISRAETESGHERTVLFGDFNANPFEPAVFGSGGLHAVASRRVASARSRELLGTESKFFYNPMWGLLGDARAKDRSVETPGGTYFYTAADPHDLYWHMLDQVVIRPDVIPMFEHDGLRVLTRVGDGSFVTGSGVPDRRTASDHLPVLFSVDHRLTLTEKT